MPNDLTTALSNFLGTLLGGRPAFAVGAGTGTAAVSGVLTVSTTSAGTIADTNETDLWTYSLPANTLNANGKGVRITVWGTFAANADNKTIKLYFGSTVVYTRAGSDNGALWKVVAEVARTGASAQAASGLAAISTAGIAMLQTTPAADTTAAITIKVTGTNGTAAANDIVFKGAIVEVLN